MTTVITRLYAKASTAKSVSSALRGEGIAPAWIDVIAAGEGAQSKMEAAKVRPEAAAAYAAAMTEDSALVVVRAPTVPFGTALKAIKVVDGQPAVDAGVEKEDHLIRSMPRKRTRDELSILAHHPRFFGDDVVHPAHKRRRRMFSERFGWPLLSSRKPGNVVWKNGGLVTAKYFPLLSMRSSNSAMGKSGLFLSPRLGMSTISQRRR